MEGKLAEPASKRPLALTIGAAAVTLLVIIGVLSGPSVVTCFNSADGMGQCLRGKMVEVGLIPAPPATTVADAEAAPQGTVNVAVPEASSEPAELAAVSPEPELAVEPPPSEPLPPTTEEPTPPVEDVVAATFGLLRAEPDGSVVIAGSGTPGSEVQVFANGELLGSITVEPSGDWVYVPDAPLPPGGLEITLGEVGKPGTSAESFIVVIDEDKTEQPLVVASTPGEASQVLQGLTAPDAAEQPMQTAQADIAPPEAETVPPAAGVADAVPMPPQAEEDTSAEGNMVTAALPPEAVTPQPSVAEPADPQDAASTPAANDAPQEPAPTAPAPETPVPQAEQQVDVPAVTPDAALPSEAPTEATQPSSPPVETSVDNASASAPSGESTAPAEPEEDVAALEQPLETPQAPVTQMSPPTIDAIEIEGDRSFFAGAGPEGATVRLYVDNAFVADTTVSEGRWLVEAGPVLDAPSQRVRVDLLEPGSAEVAARAEVNFVVEMPQSGQQVQVAQAETPTQTASSADQATDGVTNPSPASVPPAPGESPDDPAPAVSTPATPAEPPVAQPAPASAPPATPGPAPTASQPEIDAPASPELPDSTEPEPSSEPAPQAPGVPQAVEAPAPASPASDPAPVKAPAIASDDPELVASDNPVNEAAAPAQTATAPVEGATAADPSSAPATAVAPSPAEPASPPAEPEIPTMVAVSLGDPDSQRFASGKAIIRRGDNLWTIARRVYGEGIKYTTIYDANTGQIRDPDRIYPGQVFDLPNGG